MWRSVIAVLLVSSMLWAQEPSSSPDKPESSKLALRQDYHVVTEWQTMKRGTTQKAIIRFFLIPSYIVSAYEPSRDLVPLRIELDHSEGVAATSFRFDTDRGMHFTFRDETGRKEKMLQPPNDSDYAIPGDPGSAANRHGFTGGNASATPRFSGVWPSTVRVLSPTFEVAIKLKASKRATLGPHTLHGKITYQPIFDNGVLPPQEMEFAVPITVVDNDAISQRNSEYIRDYGSQADTKASSDASSKGQKVGIILLATLMAPLLLLERIACGFWGEDCSC